MTRYALVIGIQKYGGSGFGDLKKPVEDAEAIAQILEAHGDFVEVTRLPSQWDVEKQGYQMVEADLKGVDLEKAIIGFFEKVGSNEALIYFSGHGAQVTKLGQKKGYLVTSDCTSENIASAGIALEDLNGLILNADFSSLVVLLDCCHSGSLLEKSQISSALSTFLSGKCNYFLATACRSHEKAYEGEDYSLFTAAVIKALKSPSADGRVRTAQLNQVIDEELRGSGQEPVVLKSGGEITLVTYPSTGKNESVCSDKLQNAIAKLRSDYEILDAAFFELVAAKVANKQARTQILKLRAANWSMLFQENYVERDQQGEALEKALQLSENDGISLMLIRGEPGAGKTALLRWLAYELFCQGKRVFHKKSQNQVVWLEQLREFSDESGGEHFYVIADDLFRDDSFLEELQQNEFLFPLTLIGTTRQNEDRHYDLEGLEYEVVCLDLAKPSAVEKGRILALPEVQTHLAGKSTAERQQLMDSPIMLVLMLQLSEGKPFDEVLRGIVKDLPSQDSKPIYQAFGVLCSFFQFGIIVPFEILHLCLPRSNWLEKMILSELEGIIDRRIYSGYEGLTTVHELIAKTVMELEYRPKDSGNHPYTSTRRPLIERYLKAIIPQLEPMNTTQKWWINHSFRKLVEKNAAPELAREIIQNHSQYIKLLQQWNTISEWVSWASIYEKLGCLEQQQVCISSILLTQPQSSSDWINWLTFVQRFGSRKQQQQAIIQTQSWLDSNLDNGEVRTRYMSLVAQLGSLEQQQQVIIQTQSWLENHTNDWYVRTKYLALVVQLGSQEQQQQAIIQTQSWLNAHPDDREVRRQYLALVAQLGSREQQQQAIIQIQSWLDTHPDNCDVRTQYLALIGKTEKKSIATESLILNQWQWIMRQSKLDLSLWTCFLSVLYHHVSPNHELYNAAVNIVLKEYPDNPQIIGQVFGYFRDYLDYTTCRHLAMEISETNLPIDKWQNYVHAANFFRDYNDFDKAKAIYNRIISVKKKKIKQFPNLVKAIDFANLSYAKLLLLTNPTQPDEAIEKLNCILLQNPKHGYAHLLIAQSYQDKGIPFYSEAINHFEKAIQYDIKKDGFFYCLFGCFYRYAVGNIQQAKEHFEKSLNQKINLPACIELAELEATEGNLEQAKTLLESGLAIIPITRPQKEEREKLCDRIIALQTLLNLPMF
ncbi:MAG: caspase family protein [Pseudanabaena sp.]